MTDRILDISDSGCRLRVENRQLLISRDEGVPASIPLEEVAALVVSQAYTTYSHAVLSGLAEHGGVLVVCDSRCLPCAMMLPLYGHSLQAQRLAEQIAVTKPVRKRLWQAIVQAKVRNQAAILQGSRGEDAGLSAMAERVRSGDPDNIESQAARVYWARLFGGLDFRRTPGEGNPPNHFLDYGYAVLRGIVARSICGSGLNPTLGIHHRHRDNSFCLADDLMEPFRPLVDRAVVNLIKAGFGQEELNRKTKGLLLEPLLGRITWQGELRTLFDVSRQISGALADVFRTGRGELPLPDLRLIESLE